MIWFALSVTVLAIIYLCAFVVVRLTSKKSGIMIVLIKAFDWFLIGAGIVLFLGCLMFLSNQFQAHGAGKVCFSVDQCYSV